MKLTFIKYVDDNSFTIFSRIIKLFCTINFETFFDETNFDEVLSKQLKMQSIKMVRPNMAEILK